MATATHGRTRGMSKQLRIAFRKYGKPVIAHTFRGYWFTPYNTIVLGGPTEKDHICTPGSRNIACAYHICFGVVRSVSSFTRPKRQYIRDREVFPLMSFIHLASVKREAQIVTARNRAPSSRTLE